MREQMTPGQFLDVVWQAEFKRRVDRAFVHLTVARQRE
ncbi:hypothetical protein RSPO_m00403 (plasmid) [Ralstonia solanacearum Po82]|uniref:Uncharacterized protein n=1 Tax=Ralstonia solanacearum (strain Po82) TaxID=1031711 RepID=F6G7P1_RALS8|nr:hypothetical protein RSPO_m00403 [Ralstonia solanacearum Po82]